MRGRVLVIAGSDSGGGAGIQADLKTLAALSCYGTTAVTALTAQDTQKVHDVMPVPPKFVARQIAVVLDDIGADCIKIGMLSNQGIIEAVADVLDEKAAEIPLVIDPVMVAKGGDPLLDPAAVAAFKRRLLYRAALITPNTEEAARLAGMAIDDAATAEAAAEMLLTLGCGAVLVTGGHLPGSQVRDILVDQTGRETFVSPRIETPHTHGTGCTLASAIAAGLAQGLLLRDAIARGRNFVAAAIAAAPGLGHGHGPLGHGHHIPPYGE